MCTISASTVLLTPAYMVAGWPPAAAAAICRPYLDIKSYNSLYEYCLAWTTRWVARRNPPPRP
ncbi:hypothetical protein PR003_g5431 [Phytophthora rubi]|uniref:Secreted protein n=1 Tax=Phytophthora rubi TaxID=129364 RepID=A0A6A4FJI0_9STRA|nr:hypothetical protein PR002_g5641 [Phytophthora rubi]KAE9041935.1 hypothetical protein PR001_g6418 [Phytophthora rubi]KAE9350295.1 hypothetical protein PR003_g5431 [Phytophthora rubi]